MRMPADRDLAKPAGARSWRRFLPLGLVLVLTAGVLASGAYRYLSLETLVRHRAAIDDFVSHNQALALLAYVAAYVVAVALSVPGALFLTLIGGILFGAVLGGGATVIGATLGATAVFVVARSAFGEQMLRRVGPRAEKLAAGFRADAFNYLLFLRLVPLFPFWLVNLAPALFGVPLSTYVLATLLGIIPGTLAFSFVGAGLDSVLAAQAKAYMACLEAGQAACRLDFDPKAVLTPKLLGALVALGIVSLIPVVAKRWRSRRAPQDPL
jgi:uncharacterized membrane protein YdjX (TVP38/TMEM64 family)